MTMLRALGCVALVATLGCGPSGAAPETAPVAIQDTTLGTGDVFEVRVYGDEDLSGKFRVGRDGTIDFPFIGKIEVEGLEPSEVGEALAVKLEDRQYLRDPQISVFVEAYESKRVNVVGAVKKPGTFPISPGMTVVQAVSQAGGFTPLANRNSTVVTRREGEELKRYRVPVEDITEGSAEDFPVQAGDTVYVPERMF